MTRVPETRAARWFRCCVREITARRSRPRRGCSRNTLRMIAALRYRASRQFRRTGDPGIVLRQLSCGRYSSSYGLSLPLRELRAAEEAEVAAGGLARYSVG